MTDIYSEEKRSEIMSRIGVSGTDPELAVREVLEEMDLSFETNRDDLPGRPDIVLPERHIAVFVHGCFWHRHDCSKATMPDSNREFWKQKFKRNVERDREVQEDLTSDGWRVGVIWECQTSSGEKILDELTNLLAED